MTNKNIDKLPETYTVSYFNESEWNKDLTSVEIEQQQELADLQNQLVPHEKVYEPCHNCGNTDLTFKLIMVLKSWDKGEIGGTVFSTGEVERAAREIREGTGNWKDRLLIPPFGEANRGRLASKIMMWVDIHNNGQSVNETVTSDSDKDQGCSSM